MTVSARAGLRVAAAAVAGLVVVAAQSDDTLWTRVTAEGAEVIVSWDKKHPMDAWLVARGLELIAEYPVEGGRRVAERISRQTAGDGRSVRFRLPASVASTPAGEICLQLRAVDRGGGTVPLPVRKPDARRTDTSRFRYSPWAQQVTSRAVARATLARAESDLEALDKKLSAQVSTIAERGWSGPAACDLITVRADPPAPPPYDVVPPEEYDAVARRVCVHRVWRARQQKSALVPVATAELARLNREAESGSGDGREVLRSAAGVLIELLSTGYIVPEAAAIAVDPENASRHAGLLDQARRDQAAAFRRDWGVWSPSMHEYEPHLGSADDTLPLTVSAAQAAVLVMGPSLAAELGAAWLAPALVAADASVVAGFVGGALEAYTGCVDDGRKQLAIKQEAWQAAERRRLSGDRERSLQDLLVRECRAETRTHEHLIGERDVLQRTIAEQRSVLARLDAASDVAWRPRELNSLVCR